MTTRWSYEKLKHKTVYSQEGREVGEIVDLDLDIGDWTVLALRVKLRRDVLEELNLKRPFLGSQTVRFEVDQVSGISDTVVLKSRVSELSHYTSPERGEDEAETGTEESDDGSEGKAG